MLKKFAAAILFLLAACGSPDEPVQRPAEDAEQSATSADVAIEVLEENTIPGARRSLDVRLSQRVSEGELREIAQRLMERDPNPYDRTFIVYYLPGMEPGAGGWATSHFSPDLEIRILGTTEEQEKALGESAEEIATEERIGLWVGDQPYLPARITLYRKEGETFILRTYADGSGGSAEVIETQTSSGQRYHEPGSGGDYVLVTPSGFLEQRDDEGLIATFRPAR
jgi:hypothetical protein